jgi:ATP sulfurylase
MLPTFSIENDTTSGAPKRLVSSCSNNITVFKRAWAHTRSHQTTDVCHVGHQEAINVVCNLTKTSIVEIARITGKTFTRNEQMQPNFIYLHHYA